MKTLTRFPTHLLEGFRACGCTFGFILMTGNADLNVERCDTCAVFKTDEDAAEFAHALVRDVQRHLINGEMCVMPSACWDSTMYALRENIRDEERYPSHAMNVKGMRRAWEKIYRWTWKARDDKREAESLKAPGARDL